MDIVDIYGHIPDKSEIIMGIGNYNNIHGLLTYHINENTLQMKLLSEIVTSSILQLTIKYETPSTGDNLDRVYFSLAVKDILKTSTTKNLDKYVNIRIEPDGNNKIACAYISHEKALFWIDYSNIDKVPRSQLLAGALYSLQTSFGEQNYVVSWKIQGNPNGDLIIFIPTTWYERIVPENICQKNNGIATLFERLNQISFKGYTTYQWCEDATNITHCTEGNYCGECLGQCNDANDICYLNTDKIYTSNFICGDPSLEPKLNKSSLVSPAEETLSTTGNAATWVVIIIIFILVIALVWSISNNNIQ